MSTETKETKADQVKAVETPHPRGKLTMEQWQRFSVNSHGISLEMGWITKDEFAAIERLMKRTSDPYAHLIFSLGTQRAEMWASTVRLILAQESTDTRDANWRAEHAYAVCKEPWFVKFTSDCRLLH